MREAALPPQAEPIVMPPIIGMNSQAKAVSGSFKISMTKLAAEPMYSDSPPNAMPTASASSRNCGRLSTIR